MKDQEEYEKQLYPIYGIVRAFYMQRKQKPSIITDLLQSPDQRLMPIYCVFHGMCISFTLFTIKTGLELLLS